ncbi:MAG: hypothetical protein LBS86_05565 [Treponema sp.]|jgi:transposase|nr:hypothetical protein [Treponema sp.]
MMLEQEAVIRSNALSFDAVLDETCERLWGKKVRFSLKRLDELDGELRELEQELDQFLSNDQVTGV